jgi:hypothetical protein
MDSRKRADTAPSRVKLLAAVVGGSSVVAMGALGIGWSAKDPGGGQLYAAGGMSTGATSTQNAAPTKPVTPQAVPKITGPAAAIPTVDQKYYPSYAPPNE